MSFAVGRLVKVKSDWQHLNGRVGVITSLDYSSYWGGSRIRGFYLKIENMPKPYDYSHRFDLEDCFLLATDDFMITCKPAEAGS